MSASTIRAPSAAKASAMARPMPLAPPVMTTVLSRRSRMASGLAQGDRVRQTRRVDAAGEHHGGGARAVSYALACALADRAALGAHDARRRGRRVRLPAGGCPAATAGAG